MNTVTITSKNQITLPVALLREKKIARGTKLHARWEGNDLLLSPAEDLRVTVRDMQARLRPLIRKPLSDRELKQNLRNWPKNG